MDKNAIKKFAVWARRELIERVSQKAMQYGIEKDNIVDVAADSVGGKVLTDTQKNQRRALISQINAKGYEEVMEEVAYTWFNRLIALRFMEVNGYLPTRVRVFTDEENNFKPQIIDEALHLDLDGLNMEKVYEFKNANQTEELYKYLLITQCNALNSVLPGMFQRISDYTELLLPDNLLREGSVIEQMISSVPEEDWRDAVQIIGWLYQFYNTEPKQEVDAKVKKGIKVAKEDIPAKTQIFTPDWVVRYMVENTLGRIWLKGHPSDLLADSWEYYMKPAKQDDEIAEVVMRDNSVFESLKPQDIKCIDPCSGSGHILVYMFDVLMQIYEGYGYTTREAVESIVKNNLYGLDIDDRAAQLAYFAVMMKARQYDRRFFSHGIQPNVHAIVDSNHLDKFALEYFCNSSELQRAMSSIVCEMKDAKDYGSLTHVSPQNWEILYARFEEIESDITIYREIILKQLVPLVQVAKTLSQKYHAVITNPPYLGGGGMNEKLAEFAREKYFEAKNDLFSVFIERGNELALPGMYNCMVTMQSWMFLSSYEKLRAKILDTETIETLLHMDNQVMGIAFGTAVAVLRTKKINGYKGVYNYIYYSDVVNDKPSSFPVKGNRFAEVSDEYYRNISGSPIAYWISPKTRDSFMAKDSIGTVAPPKQGLATADNEHFLRLWHEVNIHKIGFGLASCEEAVTSKKKFFPYNKGGAFRRWYGNRDYVVNWENDGFEIKNFRDEKGKVRSRPQNLQYYFRPAITWSDVTSGSFSGRYAEQGFMFDIKGSSGFPDEDLLPFVLGLLNSKVAQAFIKILNPTMTTQVGDMTRIPVIKDDIAEITELVHECIFEAKADWDSFETSWDFNKHPLVRSVYTIEEAFAQWKIECNDRFAQLKANEEKLNRIFIDIYGLQDELTPDVEDKYVTIRKADLQRDIKSLISYAVGCMFGRYSLDMDGLTYAGGEWDDSKYSTYPADKDNIIPICDDEYFDDDIVGRFVKFIEKVYGEHTLEENLKFVADALGGKGQPREIIRNYFLNDFYSDHCNIYSVTGSGKRPIYWLFDSGKKNGFKALIYMHRYQPDTIARIRTDYVHEQQSRYRTAIADMENRIVNASTSERVKLNKALSKLQDQDTELRSYEEKIHHLADQMITIDLDDGVKVNYAKFQDVLAKIK
ncbi:BREX-1 system adenine-specific DNA-methyltransferase PglX [Enterocloster bolteae]|uniref:BREX-1 system adenine-specific DNA-methyltransferase PglX n=1 Tax=Enterocloster bolteae TaxID=208479 RepID=UPI002A825572|nr:BREX-1 system adenine-specific DNA-methyltransferase PglX [Enterocloster bolteae]